MSKHYCTLVRDRPIMNFFLLPMPKSREKNCTLCNKFYICGDKRDKEMSHDASLIHFFVMVHFAEPCVTCVTSH